MKVLQVTTRSTIPDLTTLLHAWAYGRFKYVFQWCGTLLQAIISGSGKTSFNCKENLLHELCNNNWMSLNLWRSVVNIVNSCLSFTL